MTVRVTLPEALFRAASRFGQRTAVTDPRRSLTHQELARQVMGAAHALQDLGLNAGVPVLISIPNSVEFVIAHFGVLAAGGISVPCEARAPVQTLAAIADRTDAKLAIVSPDVAAAWREIDEMPALRLVSSGSKDAPDGTIDFASAIAGSLDRPDLQQMRRSDDIAAIMFTTGSTGRPKGVVLTHEQTLFTINNLIAYFGYSPEDREVVTIPISHSFGLGHVYCNLFSGGAVHVEHGLTNLKRVFNALIEFRATGFPGTPTGFSLMMDRAAPILQESARHLRFIVIDSAPMPPMRTAQLQALLPDTEIFVYYGLTEASRATLISLTKEGPSHYASAGQPQTGVEVMLAPDNAEVLIRGPNLADGYWRDDELTREVYADGWLHTGDIGRFDDHGFLFLTGRLKDQINVGGHKVDPTEIEVVVRGFGAVKDTGVCGIDGFGGVTGESVICAVVPGVPGTIDTKALIEHCSHYLEHYKIPVAWLEVDCVPRSETGKVLRGDLRKLVSAKLAEMN